MPSVRALAPLTLEAQQIVASGADCEFAVFIGPQKSFTQTVLRIVDEEIDEVLPVRYESFDDFMATIADHASGIRLVIVDACVCDTVLRKVRDLVHANASEFPQQQVPSFVVAYWNEADAHCVFERLGGTSGVQGFLPMNQSIDIWLAVMRLFLSGGTYFPPEVQDHPAPSPSQVTPLQPVSTGDDVQKDVLTEREVAVMEEVVNGLQNKQIAAKLQVSEHTIKLHIHHIITKLQVSNRTAAAMKFVDTAQHVRP